MCLPLTSRTLDVTIFTIDDIIIETKATAGNIQLGGEDDQVSHEGVQNEVQERF